MQELFICVCTNLQYTIMQRTVLTIFIVNFQTMFTAQMLFTAADRLIMMISTSLVKGVLRNYKVMTRTLNLQPHEADVVAVTYHVSWMENIEQCIVCCSWNYNWATGSQLIICIHLTNMSILCSFGPWTAFQTTTKLHLCSSSNITNNNNIHDNVYGAEFMADPLQQFTPIIWWLCASPRPKPTILGCESASGLLPSTSAIAINHY